MGDDLLAAIASGVLSGGLISGGVAIYRAKRLATPERDSYIADASHDTVASMQILVGEKDKTLAEKDKRIAELETQRERDAMKIDRLERDIKDLQGQYAQIAGLLTIAQKTTGRLQRELAELRADRADNN